MVSVAPDSAGQWVSRSLVVVGVVLIGVSLPLPWVYAHDWTGGEVIDVRITRGATTVGFPVLGHLFVLPALPVLVARGLTAARPTRAWWVASVAAMVVGGFGVLVYWCGGALTSSSEADAEGEVGPGVPLFTLGFVAVVVAAALRLRAGDARRSPDPSLAP